MGFTVKRYVAPWLVSFPFVLTCACAGLQTGAADKAARIVALESNQGISHEKRITRELKWAGRFTDEEFTSKKLRTYSPETLKLLLESLDTASFASRGAPRYVSMQARVFDELAARKLQTAADAESLFHKYLSARMFDQAISLKSRFPDANLWDIPEIVESSEPGTLYKVYDISNDSQTARVRYLPMETGPKIVIAAMGGCPVTSRALKYVETDQGLLQALQSNGIILTIRFEPGGVALLNSKTSAARLYVAYSREAWPGIDFSRSPTFYFLKDGKILHQFVGWAPGEKSVQDFNKGLNRIGLKKS